MPLIRFRLFNPPIIPDLLAKTGLASQASKAEVAQRFVISKATDMINGSLIKSASHVAAENALKLRK